MKTECKFWPCGLGFVVSLQPRMNHTKETSMPWDWCEKLSLTIARITAGENKGSKCPPTTICLMTHSCESDCLMPSHSSLPLHYKISKPLSCSLWDVMKCNQRSCCSWFHGSAQGAMICFSQGANWCGLHQWQLGGGWKQQMQSERNSRLQTPYSLPLKQPTPGDCMNGLRPSNWSTLSAGFPCAGVIHTKEQNFVASIQYIFQYICTYFSNTSPTRWLSVRDVNKSRRTWGRRLLQTIR